MVTPARLDTKKRGGGALSECIEDCLGGYTCMFVTAALLYWLHRRPTL